MQWNNRTEDNQYISGNSLRVYGVLYFTGGTMGFYSKMRFLYNLIIANEVF